MDQTSPPQGRGEKTKHSAAIRMAIRLYPEARPATAVVRICTGVSAIVVIAILAWFAYFAIEAMDAGVPEMILIMLIMPAGLGLLLLGDWVGAWSRRNSKMWGLFYKEGKDEKFAKIILRRLARLLGITPLLVGGLAVGVFGRLKCREIRLEHTQATVPIWLHRSVSTDRDWQFYETELSCLNGWVATRGPRRVYIRTNLGRELCTTPSGYYLMRQAADQICATS
ncbi:MAG: hypothetical protein ACIAQF_08420 [Phycisphaerales bacterium JB065]